MTKEEEVKIVAKLVEKYPELKAKNCIVNDGLFRRGSNKKSLTIITDEEDKKLFHKCIKMREERKQKETPKKETPPPKKAPVKEETPKKETPPPKKAPVKEESPVKEEPPVEKVLSEPKPEITPEDIRELTDDESSELSVHEVTDNLDFCKSDLPKKKIYHVYDYDKGVDYIFCRGLPQSVITNIKTGKNVFEGLHDSDYEFCFKTYYACTNDKVYSKEKLDKFFKENITDIILDLGISDKNNIFVKDNFINNDDTNKIFLNKIVSVLTNIRGKNKQLLTSKEIFAWFNDKGNIKPIGFDYENNKLDMKDEKLKLFLDKKCSNPEIIDSNFVDDEGRRIIDNKLIEKYNELFENNNISGNVIFFRTLESFLMGKGCNPHKTHSTERDIEDITIRQWLFGVITKYWPKIDNTLYITDFLNPSLAKERNDSKKNIEFLENYNHNIKNIESCFVDQTLEDIDISCNKFIISLLQIRHIEDIKDNYIDIVKLFCDFSLHDKTKSGIHYEKLTVKNNNESYYKFYKPRLKYNSNFAEGILDLETCNKWIKGHYIPNKYGLPDYLYSSDTFLMKLYIKSLSCEEHQKYVTLVFHRDGRIQCIIDTNISKADLKSIVKECNKKIDEINRHKIYSEKNMEIERFDENFLKNNKNTIIGKFNCEMFLSLVKNKNPDDLLEKINNFQKSEEQKTKPKWKGFILYTEEKPDNKEFILSDKDLLLKLTDYFNENKISKKIICKENKDKKDTIEIQDELVSFDVKRFTELLVNFYTYIRVEKEIKTDKEKIYCIYKKVNNYENLNNIETLIAKLSNPDIQPPFTPEQIIEEIMNVVQISFGEAEKRYNEWRELYDIAVREGKRFSEGIESGVNIIFSQSGSNIKLTLKNVNDYKTFERINIFLQSLIHIYKHPKLLSKVGKIVEEVDDLQVEQVENPDQDLDDVLQETAGKSLDEQSAKKPPAKKPEPPAKKPEPPAEKPEPPAKKPEPPAKKPEPPAEKPEPPAKKPEPPVEKPEPPKKSSSSDSDSDSDSDDDDDDDDDDDSEDVEFGGGSETKGYLLKKLREYDPVTYGKTISKILKGYDMRCPNSAGKQPVVLTRDELLRINNSDPSENSGYKSYTNKLRASDINVHNKDPNLFYICPKYFDIKKRLSLDPEKVEKDDGELKPEYKANNYIIKRTINEKNENIEYWSKIPFNKYIADIQHPDNSVYTPVCCGKKGFKGKSGIDRYNFEKNKIIEDDVLPENPVNPENPEKPKPDRPKEVSRNYISDKTPTDIGRVSYLFMKQEDKAKVSPPVIGDLDNFFEQGPRNILQDNDHFFLKLGVKQNTLEKRNETPSIINACFQTLKLYMQDDLKPNVGDKNDYRSDNSDKLYENMKKFISKDDLSLLNYLSMGNTMISLIFKRNENDLTDNDIIDFFEFAKNPNQLESLNITIDKKFLTIKTVEEFFTTLKPNSINFALHLFLSRKYYLEYLASNEFKDDKYILPLLNIYNQNLYKKLGIESVETQHQFIVLENIDGEIMIKDQFSHIDQGYNKYSFIYKEDFYYEPIILFQKDGNTQFKSILYDSKLFSTLNSTIFEYVNTTITRTKFHEIEYYVQKHYNLTVIKVGKFGKPVRYFVNSNNKIAYVITKKNFILPYIDTIKPEYKGKLVYDLTKFISKSPSLDEYLDGFEALYNFIKLKENIIINKFAFFYTFYITGLSVDENDNIVNIILKNECYIPVKPVKYTNQYNKKFRKLYDYDLYLIDNTIQNNINNFEDKEFIEAKANIEKHNEEKYLTDKLFKKLYFDINEKSELEVFHIIDTDGIREGNKYKFIKDSDKDTIRKLQKTEDSFIDYDYFVRVNKIKKSDNSIELELKLIDKIKYILNSCEINEHKRIKLFQFLKSKFRINGKLDIKILYKFIDILIINKDDLQNIYSIIEEKININMLQDCIKKDELFFSRTQYINDYLIDFYFKNSRFILNNEKPLEIKPIVSVLKIIPNYIKKFFTNAELVYPEKDKNDIEFLAYCLSEMGITPDSICDTLINSYESKLNEPDLTKQKKNIDKMKKYIDDIDKDIQGYIQKIKEREYKLDSLDFNILQKALKIGIIYINDNDNRYKMEIYPKKTEEQVKYNYIVLYKHYDKFQNYKIGCIRLADNFLNTFDIVKELSKGKI